MRPGVEDIHDVHDDLAAAGDGRRAGLVGVGTRDVGRPHRARRCRPTPEPARRPAGRPAAACGSRLHSRPARTPSSRTGRNRMPSLQPHPCWRGRSSRSCPGCARRSWACVSFVRFVTSGAYASGPRRHVEGEVRERAARRHCHTRCALPGGDSGARGGADGPGGGRARCAARAAPRRSERAGRRARAARRGRFAGDDGHRRAALLRLRHRRLAAGRAGGELARGGVGPERGVRLRRRPPSRGSRPSRWGGCASCSRCPRAARAPSSPAPPWPTSARSPPRGTRCSRRRAGTSRRDGLFGAPPITVVIGEEAHPTLIKALGLVGFGRNRVVRVPVDGQGRMRADALPPLSAADDRVRAGRQRQHRRLRSARGDLRARRARRAPGCTSTARSACGRPPQPAARTSLADPSSPTRGRPTRTSGSTCRTTAAWPSCATPRRCARRWP